MPLRPWPACGFPWKMGIPEIPAIPAIPAFETSRTFFLMRRVITTITICFIEENISNRKQNKQNKATKEKLPLPTGFTNSLVLFYLKYKKNKNKRKWIRPFPKRESTTYKNGKVLFF